MLIAVLIIIFIIAFSIFHKVYSTPIGKHDKIEPPILLFLASGYLSDKKTVMMYKKKNGNYQFDNDHCELKLLDFSWYNMQNHTNNTQISVVKHKNVIGRSLTSGAIAGIGGAIIGGATSKSETNTSLQQNNYQTVGNAVLTFQEIGTDKQHSMEINLETLTNGDTKQLDKLIRFLGIQPQINKTI